MTPLLLFAVLSASLNCLFTNTVHLEVDFRGYVLRPEETVEVPITFYPREAVSYQELIPFEINGLCQQTVEVRGRGTEMKVRWNPNPKNSRWQPASVAFSLIFLISLPQPTVFRFSATRVAENLFSFFPFVLY